MSESTFIALFEKKYINNKTEFTMNDGCCGTITKAVKKDNTVKLTLLGHIKSYTLEHIALIDGMDMSKFCQAYNLEADGNYCVIEINAYTDCVRDIVGKKFACIGDVRLENNMKLWFNNEQTLEYQHRLVYVAGVGDSIRLIKRGRPKLYNCDKSKREVNG
jgi:hypothetical protein